MEAYKSLGNVCSGGPALAGDVQHLLRQPHDAVLVALVAVWDHGERGDAVQQRLEFGLFHLLAAVG